MPTTDDLLEGLLNAGESLGSQIRYGMNPTEKYKRLLESPDFQEAKDESDRTEAERANSVRLAGANLSAYGPVVSNGAPIAANLIREGIQGARAVAAGKPFFTPGGFEARDQTESDENPTGGFNLRTMKTAVTNVPAARFMQALLSLAK